MDVLLPVLQVLFFAPVIARLASRSGSRAKVDLRGAGRGLRQPGILVHLLGGVLLLVGTLVGLATGQVQRSVSVGGAAGAATILLAAAILTWSLATLRSWRLLPEVDAGHELCTTGPYALVRHPMYLAIDLLGLGVAIWVPTAPIMIGAAALWVGGDLRARAEERVLLESFGNRYRDYMARVPRMIPGLY